MTNAVTVQVPASASRRQRLTARAVHSLSLRASQPRAEVPSPDVDSFYRQDVGPEGVSGGHLLDIRRVDLPGPRWLDVEVRQIRFVSCDDQGPFVAVATILCPEWTASTPQPLLSYQVAINSLAPEGDPSYRLRSGALPDLAFLRRRIEQGWAVVLTDFRGPRHAYGITGLSGRVVLDGVTATLATGAGGLGQGSGVVLWGYSAGGYASMQAAEQARTHAPGIDVRAVVAGGVPADVGATIELIDGSLWAGLSVGVVAGIARNHPEFALETRLNDEGAAAVADTARMTTQQLAAAYPYRHWSDLLSVSCLDEVPGFSETVKAIDLGRAVPTADVHLYHPANDKMVPVDAAQRLAHRYRSAGATVTWSRIPLLGHMSVAVLGVRGANRRIAPYAAPVDGTPGVRTARPPRTTPDQLGKARIRTWMEGKVLESCNGMVTRVHGDRKQEVIGSMRGTVVEIGPGTGVNMPYYGAGVRVIAIEPNPNMHGPLRARAEEHGVDLEIRTLRGERIDLPSESADAVVGTLVLCGVDDPQAVVAEIHRVLKPGGSYFFLEHVAAEPGTVVRRIQDLVLRPQRWLANGCETNRDTAVVIDAGGFSETSYEHLDPGGAGGYTRPHLVGTARK